MYTKMRTFDSRSFSQVAILRNKHASQQKIVNKLIQFLVTMVQPGAAARMSHTGAVSPAVAASIKRKFASPLAIEDESGASVSKEPRMSAVRAVAVCWSRAQNFFDEGVGRLLCKISRSAWISQLSTLQLSNISSSLTK